MAHSLKLSVVAEGVENAQQETILKTEGCKLVQGFHYGGALAPAEFERLLAGAKSGALN